MTLDPDKQARLEAWIAAKIVRRHCPACEHAVDWEVAEMLDLDVAPCEAGGGVSVPVVPLVCPHCGYVTPFSAKLIGLCDEA
jgi:hypothetical protein